MEKLLQTFLVFSSLILHVHAQVGTTSCTSNDNCVTLANTQCSGSTCECKVGYKANGDASACIPNTVGDACTDANDCQFIANSHCPSGTCSCTDGHTANAGDSTCIVVALGAGCTTNTDCSTIANAECSGTSGSETCSCKTGFSSSGGSCSANRIGSACNTNTDCSTVVTNSQCSNNVCECLAGHTAVNENTQCDDNVIGSPCTTDTDCSSSIANSECSDSNQCACSAGHVADAEGTSCTQIHLEGTCTLGSSDCDSIANAECRDDGSGPHCLCVTGYEGTSGTTTCNIKNCGVPGTIDGYSFGAATHTTYLSTVSVTCASGWETNPDEGSIICQADGTWSTPTGCARVDCGTPSAFTGYVVESVGSCGTVYECTVSTTCADGYEGTGTDIVCQDDRTWMAPTGCQKKDCGNPSFEGYSVGTPDPDTLFEATVSVTGCATGFETDPSTATLTCTAAGTWAQPAGCTRIDCNVPTTSDPAFEIGSYLTTDYQSTATITCAAGYEGTPDSIICQSDGYWSTPTGCLPVDCGPNILTGYSVTGPTTYGGGEVAVTCDTGYAGTPDSTTMTCETTGQWSAEFTGCLQECPVLTAPTDGSLSTSDHHEGVTVTLTCSSGYSLVGVASISCSSGSWSPASLGTCEQECPAITVPTDGTLSTTDHYEGITVSLTCSSGYSLVGVASISCSSGSWSPALLGTCEQECPALTTPTDGSLSTTDHYEGVTVTLTCSSGYSLVGVASISCSSGLWSPASLGTCEQECATLTVPTDGSLSTTDHYEGVTVTLTCSSGYSLVGVSSISCSSGSWSPASFGTCEQECPAITEPTDGSLSTTDHYQGITVSLTCSSGYSLVGVDSISCSSGSWSPASLGTCEQECPALTTPTDGSLSTADHYEGVTVTLTCSSGYSLVGVASISCSSGSWSPASLGTCEQECPTVTEPTDGSLSTTDHYEGVTVTLTCSSGYSLVGVSSISCSSGSWSPASLGTCEQECPAVTEPTDGSLSTTNHYEGITVSLTCSSGYSLVGVDSVSCSSGSWSPASLGTCEQECSAITAPTDGSLSTTDHYEGITVTLTCGSGYSLVGASSISCSSGSWSPASLGTCEQECPVLTAPTGGSLSTLDHHEGVAVTLTCSSGYTLVGVSSISCSSGSWSPASLGTCEQECPAISEPTDGSLSTTDHYEGVTVTLTCNSGYSLVGTSSISCGSGSWSPASFGTCEQECPAQTAPADGSLSTTDHFEGVSVTLTCSTGYTLVGASSISCSSGTWSPASFGTCEQECPVLTAPTDGSLSTTDHYEGVAVTLTCGSGYSLVGVTSISCSSGSWSPASLGTCEQECPAVTAPTDGSLSTTDHYEGVTVSLTCSSGYTLVGVSSISCSSGSWSPASLGTCEQECPGQTAPADGSLSTTDHFEGVSVTLTCSTGYTLVGASSISCSSGSWSPASFGTCEQECPVLTAPTDGSLSTSDHHEGVGVTLTCGSGYSLVGVSSISCSSGSWSPASLGTCEQECPAVTAPTDGSLSTTDHYEGVTISLTCSSGYTLVGVSSISCSSGSWSPASLGTCEQECPAQTAPTDGSLSTTDHFEGVSVTLTCSTGYTLVGASSISCSSGSWSPASFGTCEQECPVLSTPTDSSLSTTDHHEGVSVTLTCSSGYSLVGVSSISCSSGSWSPASLGTCEQECPAITGPTGGSLSTTDHYEGVTVSLTCDSGYTLLGVSSIACGSGSWSPASLGTCEQECPALSAPTDGSLSTTDHYEGVTVSLTCTSGYTLVGVSSISCSSGAWSPSSLGTCEQECPVLTAPTDGSLSTTDHYEGVTVTLTCSSGYSLVGVSSISCSSGSWSPASLGTCEQECSAITAPTGGSLSTTDHYEGVAVTLTCISGYVLVGVSSISCSSGSWSPSSLGTCEQECPALTAPTDGSLSSADHYEGVTVSLTCTSGYTLVGVSSISCSSGAWSPSSLGTCEQECPVLTAPTDGSLSTTDHYEGVTVTLTCSSGYSLVGVSSISCSSGSWSPASLGTCEQECSAITAPTGGSLSTTDHHEGVAVTLTCISGYVLVGVSSISCSSGSWSPASLGTCEQECPALAAPTDGSLSTTDRYEGVTVTLTCTSGYTLVGVSSISCSSASWSPSSLGTCEQECPALTAPTEGSLSTTDHHEGITVTLTCSTGFTLVGVSSISCSSGSWSPSSLGTCEQECSAITAPTGGALSTTDHYEGVAVTLTCSSGYVLVGVSSMSCSSGSWSPASLGTCEQECPAISGPTDGSLSTTDHHEGITVTLTCSSGYTLVGVPNISCTSGSWSPSSLGTCEQECPAPTTPSDSSLSTTDHYEGVTVTLTCSSGYSLVGVSSISCSSGSWSPASFGTCEQECPAITGPTDGSLSTTDHYEGVTVTLTCSTGYTLVGVSSISCSSGSWSPASLGTCEQECPALTVPTDGSLSTTDHHEGITVALTCNSGYTLVGVASISCSSGSWSPSSLGTCEQECPALTAPTDGSLSTTNHYEGVTVSLTCNSGYTLVGVSSISCSSGSWSPASFGTCEQECPAVTAPTGGSLSTTDHYEGITVTLTCSTGYTLVGVSSISCSSGSWSAASLGTCEQECPVVTAPTDGSLSTTDHHEGITILLTCNAGYSLVGVSSISCSSGSWSPSSLGTCEQDCDNPSVDSSAYVLGTVVETTFGSTVPLTCATGYTGSPNPLSCGSGGQWSDPTGCSIVDCGTPSQPGYTFTTPAGTEYQSEANVDQACSEGYTGQTTTTTVRCGADGSWTNAAGCNPVDCGSPSFDGYNFGTPTPDTLYDATVEVTACVAGYETTPSTASLSCTAGGTWEQPAGCSKKDCGVPSFEGYNLGTPSPDTMFEATVEVTACATGFETTPSTPSLACTTAGTWEEPAGCTKKNCGNPAFDGYTLGTPSPDTLYGATVAVTACAAGYETSPTTSSLTCSAGGTWDIPAGCTIKDCGNPSVDTSIYELGTVAETTFGSTVFLACATGYTGSPDPLSCESSGQWSIPTGCSIVDCGTPSQPGYTISTPSGTEYQSEGVVQQACSEGYTGQATTATVTCGAAGSWSNAQGCSPVDCGDHSLTEGYNFGTVTATTFGATIAFNCAVGYTGNDGAIACTSSATWSNPTGCAKVDCGDPAIISAGYTLAAYTATVYQSTIDVVACATGYTGTVTTALITCLSTGSWSLPQGCAIVDCEQPEQPTHGSVNVPGGTKYGAQATQSCDLGYSISGSQTIECLHTGQWSSGSVTCSRIYCPESIPPLNGGVSLTLNNEFGSTATFSCDTGFERVGSQTKQCLSSGEWSNADPICQIKGNCGLPPVISYTSVSLNDAGTIATYACVAGYTLVPADIQQLTCGSNNVWTGARPQCRIPSTNRGLSITLVSTQITLASLDDPVILAYRKKQVQNEVQSLLRRLTGILDLIFALTGLRTGSLIIEGDIILPDEKATTENYLNASSTMVYNEEPIVIDGQQGTFQSISVVNETFTKTNIAGYICKAYEQLEGPCESGYECVATSTSQTGSAECRLTAKTDNLAVILGVGIGVPVFLLILVIIIIAAIYVRRQRLRDEKYGSETDSDDKSQFAQQIATRYPGRYPYSHGVEGPGHYEADSSAYSDSRRFNYPWDYDNRFAAPVRKMYIARPKY